MSSLSAAPSTTTNTVHSASTIGYAGTHATNYQSVRPGYPDEVADYILQHTLLSPANPSPPTPNKRRILDVGAGTGKWTQTLDTALQRHHIDCELLAADPVPSMAQLFTQQLPHIPIRKEAASELQFDDQSFDLLTAATAFHWFCDPASVHNLNRILKPHAYFAVLGYDLNINECWTEPMGTLLDSYYPLTTPSPHHNHWRQALQQAEEQHLLETVAHRVFKEAAVMRTDRAGFVNRFLSASAIAALEGKEREECMRKFEALMDDSDAKAGGRSEWVMKDDVEVTIMKRL